MRGYATALGFGYSSEADYVPPSYYGKTLSLCLSYDLRPPVVNDPYTAHDPICHYDARKLDFQNCIAALAQVIDSIRCPHIQYHLAGGDANATKYGAEWIASKVS